MKILFFILFLFTVVSSAFAELKGEFTLGGQVSTIKEGDLVEGTLKIWPLENPEVSEFTKYHNSLLFNGLQLIQIQSVEPSANNADVIELKGTFIARAAKYLSSFEFNYKGQTVNIESPSLKIIPLEKKSDDFIILDQSLSLSYYQVYFILGLIIASLIIALIKREKILKWVKGLKSDPRSLAIKHFREKFQKASTREDFEEIYARKNEWLPLLEERPSVYNEFFSVMNQHQYKPSWGSEELREVKDIFDMIRGSFK